MVNVRHGIEDATKLVTLESVVATQHGSGHSGAHLC